VAHQNDRPSWPGGVAAAKPQTGWWFKIQILKHSRNLRQTIGAEMGIDSVIEPPARRFAPSLVRICPKLYSRLPGSSVIVWQQIVPKMTSFLLVLFLLGQVPASLQSQAGIVTGILRTDNGRPLAGIRVAVTPAGETNGISILESLGQTDSTGHYRLENVSPGRYHVLIGRGTQSIYHPGVTELVRATTIQVVAGSTIEVPEMMFAGDGGKSVSGRVVDLATGNGRRIEDLVLCCDRSLAFLFANPAGAVRTFSATISDDGSFEFPSIPPGTYSLSAADPKIVYASWVLAVGDSQVTGLELDVTEGVAVRGTILDQAGAPVAAVVRLRPNIVKSASSPIGPPTNITGHGALLVPRPGRSANALQVRVLNAAMDITDSLGPDGRFEFQKVYPGTYVLEVSTKGVTLLELEIQGATTGQTTITLQIPVIRVIGRVIASSGSPLPKLNYIRLVRSGTDSDVFYGFPDAEGNFSLLLAPGKYRVFTERLGPPVKSVSDGSRDITNTEFAFEGRNSQIVVTLEPVQ